MQKDTKEKLILLVEDNPDDELLTLRALHHNHIANRVVVVRDGAEALDYLFAKGIYADKDPILPTVVLLDLKLPKVGGLEVLRQIRAAPQTRTLPVVILTSSKEEVDMLKGYELGCNSYIRKPVDFQQFNESVKVLGMYWLVVNEPPPKG